MKKLLILAAIALTATACCTKGYTITGTLADSSANGTKAYLADVNAERGVYFDSVIIEGNKFVFTGMVADSVNTYYTVRIPKFKSAIVIPENEDITIDFAVDGMPSSNSSKINGVLNACLAEKQVIEQRARTLVDSLKGVYGDDREALTTHFNAIVMPIYKQFNEITEKYMQQNKENRLGAYLLCDMLYEAETLKQFDSLAAIIPAATEFRQIKDVRTKLESIEKTKAGAMFVDFDGKNMDGSEAKLSDYVGKGKYVLADFWASWCGPCKGEIPNLKFLNDNYKDLVVLGVNVWDKDDAFRTAIEEEKMNWAQLYASDDQDATNNYGIKGIPTIILFAPDGTIVDRTLRGDVMIAKIAETFPNVKTKR